MSDEGQEGQGQTTTRREQTFPFNLEQAHYIATIVGVVVALGTGIFAAWTFAYSSNVQADDAAYRVLHEHFSLRLEGIKELDDPRLMDDIEEHPKIPEGVSGKDFAIYTSVAEHGVSSAEQIYRTRGRYRTGGDAGYWRSAAERMIFDYQAIILDPDGGLDCDTFSPEYIKFVSETLDVPQRRFCAEDKLLPWWRRMFGG
jgi:hypothetical protein